jgi:hypothetical protein
LRTPQGVKQSYAPYNLCISFKNNKSHSQPYPCPPLSKHQKAGEEKVLCRNFLTF